MKICRLFHCFWLYLIRPYPFQLWIAPRNRLYDRLFSGGQKETVSPPGFIFKDKDNKKENEYAMFLYPDNLHTHWMLFFSVLLFTSEYFSFSPLEGVLLSLYFLISYYIVYIFLRKPILDDVLAEWPTTEQQKKYFQSVPSRITFISEDHFKEYHKLYPYGNRSRCHKLIDIFCCTCRAIELGLFFFSRWSCVRQKKTCYFHRPIFFNPEGSFQEGMLRTGIASFFGKENKIHNIILFVFYCLPHIWVSYIYLCGKLLMIFLEGNPQCNQEKTICLVVQIIFWLFLSILSLTRISLFVKDYLLKEESLSRLFEFPPPRIRPIIKEKLRINQKTIQFLHPKISIPIIWALVFTGYLAVLNISLQYDAPKDKHDNAKCIEEKSTPSNNSNVLDGLYKVYF